VSEAEAILTLDLESMGISDMTGIEAFTNLRTLLCPNNNIDTLDLWRNRKIMGVDCSENELKEFNILNCVDLVEFDCHENQLTELYIRNNTNLTRLDCDSNDLDELNTSDNDKLIELDCHNNPRINSLEFSNNNLLEVLSCGLTDIYSLDVSNMPNLDQFWCFACPNLSSLNIASGNCHNYEKVYIQYNPQLSCVQVDEGFSPPAALPIPGSYWDDGWYYDDDVCFSIDCNTGIPVTQIINNQTFGSSSHECFGATQTIVVAEDGNEVRFQNASNTNLIAGQSIRFLPGTVIEPGAYVHAWITTDNTFCDDLPEAIVAAPKIAEKSIEYNEIINENKPQQASIKVFPNPNNGQFNIVAKGFDNNTQVFIYNALGKVVAKERFETQISIDLSYCTKGLYFVKAINKGKPVVQKVVIR
jgi:hypothetical protein